MKNFDKHLTKNVLLLVTVMFSSILYLNLNDKMYGFGTLIGEKLGEIVNNKI